MYVCTFVGYLIVLILGLVCFLPIFISACLPKDKRYDNPVYYWFCAIFYKGVVWASFLPVKVVGKEHLPDEPGIIIANHQSAFDIPLLGSLVGAHPHFWLFLKKYSHVPVFGFIAKRMNVVVDTSGLRTLANSLHQALDLAEEKKRHILLFPEGGRNIEGDVKKFALGFASLAEELRRPVIPVMMKNVGKVYPPGSILVRRYPIIITIGEPFYFGAGESKEDFVARVYEWFKQHA